MSVEIADDQDIGGGEVEDGVEIGAVVARARRLRRDVDVDDRDGGGVREEGDGLNFRCVVELVEMVDVDVDVGDGVVDQKSEATAPAKATVFGDAGEARK